MHTIDKLALSLTHVTSCNQVETNRQLAAITAAESEAIAAALSRKMQVQEASNKEVQRLREQSAELRE